MSWGNWYQFLELIPAAMVEYGLNKVQLPLWLQQSLINGFSWHGLSLGHSGQRTSVKCAEATCNYKGGVVHLKSPALACLFVCLFLFVFVCLFFSQQ